MNKIARNLTLFSYGMCNLNCIYCFIDKNKYLKEVDDILKESFINYKEEYCDRINKWFSKDSLQTVEVWGGEPLWDIERIYPLLDWIFDNYPNFNHFFSSTNFSYTHWVEKIISLINYFASKKKEFTLDLQLSIDGPEYINDENRGKGTTKKCIDNIIKLNDYLSKNKLPSNLKVNMFNKGTLNIKNIEQDLQTKENIIDYYKFFDEFFDLFISSLDNNTNLTVRAAAPNVAGPSPITKTTGVKFANTVKLCREIEKENLFNNYEYITPFAFNNREVPEYDPSLCQACVSCGSGYHGIYMLPKGYYLTCHNAFGDLAEGYKKYAARHDNFKNKTINLDGFLEEETLPFVLNEEEYERYAESQKHVYSDTNQSLGCISLTSVKLLALANQIDKKYLNDIEAIKAVNQLSRIKLFCIHSNQLINHSFAVPLSDEYKLFLNGALEYLNNDN